MNTRYYKLGALALLLAGCMPVAPRFESSFGNAVRATVASQVADPAAARNQNPVTGIDARAAEGAISSYAHSYRQPTKPDTPMTTGSGK
ncbi:MAG: hypothetical protein V4484_02540 [Pseudomonadota bacterium]